MEMEGLGELSSLTTAQKKQNKPNQTSSKIICNWHCQSELIHFHERNNHAIKIPLESSLVLLYNGLVNRAVAVYKPRPTGYVSH